MTIKRSCQKCGNQFETKKYYIDRGKGKFCSRKCSAQSLIKTPEEAEKQFWSLIDMSGDCWIWTGVTANSGYGKFYGGGLHGAHRYSYYLHNGEYNRELFVLHRCDVRLCCRPDHLFLGTHADNMADMARKGRSASGILNGKYTKPEKTARGDKNGNAKLKESDVRIIKELYKAMNATSIARTYFVHPDTIIRIVKNVTWKHVH